MLYVNKIIMLYTLNMYSAVCQLNLNKTGRKNILIIYTYSVALELVLFIQRK